jgi:hypothetical protein
MIGDFVQNSYKREPMGGGNPNPATRFKSGSAWNGKPNPGGLPRKEPITSRLKALLDLKDVNGVPLKDGKTVADLVAEALIKRAVKGDPRHLSMLLERVEGKVVERLLVASQSSGPDISVVLSMVRESLDGEEPDVQSRVLARLAASARRIGLEQPAIEAQATIVGVEPTETSGPSGQDGHSET